MFTSRGRQSKRKYIIGICAVIFVYLFLFSRYQTYEYQEVIKNVKPEKVWDYVADFSKMKSLNPTILEFKVSADHGNNEDWKYSVEYIEKLSQWPYWKNQATGNFRVRKVIRERKYVYLVESTHKTCFFGIYCGMPLLDVVCRHDIWHNNFLFAVKSMGEFQITDLNDQDTLCTETVKYQCLPFLGAFCRKEVEYQRKKIMYNLSYHFSKQEQQQNF